MDPSFQQRLNEIVSSNNSLLEVVAELRQMKENGAEKEVVQQALEELRKNVETESEEDRILEVLDFVTGFCSPDQRIWED